MAFSIYIDVYVLIMLATSLEAHEKFFTSTRPINFDMLDVVLQITGKTGTKLRAMNRSGVEVKTVISPISDPSRLCARKLQICLLQHAIFV